MENRAPKGLDEEGLSDWIKDRIQGGFWPNDMRVQREEIQKLKGGEIYLEIGVDEGKSFTSACYYAPQGVWVIGVDYIDPPARNKYMNPPTGAGGWNPTGTGLIHLGEPHIYMHGDANMVAKIFDKEIGVLFIDGDHSYEGVKADTLAWESKVKKGGTILFHDTDHPDVFKFLNDYYGEGNWENLHGKVGRVKLWS